MPVEVKGVVEARKILRKLAPDTLKGYNAEIAAPLKDITKVARNMTPDSITGLANFTYPGYERKASIEGKRAFPSFVPNVVRRGLTYSLAKSRANRTGWVSLVSMLNKSAAGAIIETAGRKNPYGSTQSRSNNPRAGGQFISKLNDEIGTLEQTGQTAKTQGRLMGAALVENKGKAQTAVLKVLERVSKSANAEIARMKRGN
jgi:hypothetical protein